MDTESVIFHGREGEPCEGFIRAVRRAAFEAGRIRDDAWMADFASTYLDGPALRFYESLSPDVQGDWRLLRQALLAQYPLPDQVGGGMQTESSRSCHIPFAATVAASYPPQRRKGRIRVIGENAADFGYIGEGNVWTTSCLGSGASMNDALEVSYIPAGRPYEIEIQRQEGENQLLGLQWELRSPSTAVGCTNYASVTVFKYSGSHRSSTMSKEGPGYTKVWEVMPDNTLWPHLAEGNAYNRLRVFKENDARAGRSSVIAVADAGAFFITMGQWWTLAKLVFEENS